MGPSVADSCYCSTNANAACGGDKSGRKVEFRPGPGCEETTGNVCSKGEWHIHSGSPGEGGWVATLSHRYAGKPGLLHWNIPDRRAGCSTCSKDKVLVMERECLVCSFPQAAHQLNFTFSFCYNVTASDIFHPKSHKRLIWLRSYS